MKRLLSLLLVLIMLCSLLAACVDNSTTDPDDDKKEDKTTAPKDPTGEPSDKPTEPSIPTADPALTVGDYEVSGITLHYYYWDIITEFCNSFSSYGEYANTYMKLLAGLDAEKPLAQQFYNKDTGETWADHFIAETIESAHWSYALYADAVANDFKLTTEQQAELDAYIDTIDTYATYMGFDSTEAYLKAVYGETADMDSYLEYYTTTYIAYAYAQHYRDSLKYTLQELQDYEAANYHKLYYNSYSYASYYVSTSACLKFLFGTKETYTEEERALAAESAQSCAEAVANQTTSLDSMDLAIRWLELNKNNYLASATQEKYILYANINSEAIRNWVSDSTRKPGDVTVLANEAGDSVDGYYVVLFENTYENREPLANVQHILLLAKTDSEKETALAKADEILAEFRNLPAQDSVSFGALAAKYTEDSASKETGGLYENICRNQTYASNFEEWALAGHKAGDTGVITTEHGIHIMFYTGDGELTYRQYMVDTDMRTKALEDWFDELMENAAKTEVNIGCLNRDLVIAPQD